MNDEPRTAYVTSSGAFHRPGCRNLQRLAKPPRKVELQPNSPGDPFGGWTCWPAACCEQHFQVRHVMAYEWREP